MNPIVTQVLTIAGVLLGAAATFIATTTTERIRWRRVQSTRWDDKRLMAYTEYANAVKRSVRLCRRIAETKNLLLRNDFYACARADLDVTSGTLPELTWSSLEP